MSLHSACEVEFKTDVFGICNVAVDDVSRRKFLSDGHLMSFRLIFPVWVIVVDLGVAVPVFFDSKPLGKLENHKKSSWNTKQ